jgi:hypothetical protein
MRLLWLCVVQRLLALDALVEGVNRASSEAQLASARAALSSWATQSSVDALAPQAASAGRLSMQDVMRTVTSRVLQIATPEALFAARESLPKEVLEEYLFRQQHFDVPKWIADGASAAASDGVDGRGGEMYVRGVDFGLAVSRMCARSLTKTVAFTRSSADLESLMPTTPRGDGGSTRGVAATLGNTAVMQLSLVRTEKQCEEFLAAFLDAGNPCSNLLVVADMRVAGARLVNCARQIIDAADDRRQQAHVDAVTARLAAAARAITVGASGRGARSPHREAWALLHLAEEARSTPLQPHKRITIILHSNALHARQSYSALFLGHWNFMYFDEFAPSPGVIPASEWLRVACGFANHFSEGCSDVLRAANRDVLKSVVSGITGCRTERPGDAAQGVEMEPFYRIVSGANGAHMVTPAMRLQALEQLAVAMGDETLASLHAPEFLKMWTKKEILAQLSEASLRCASGLSSRSLSSELSDRVSLAVVVAVVAVVVVVVVVVVLAVFRECGLRVDDAAVYS